MEPALAERPVPSSPQVEANDANFSGDLEAGIAAYNQEDYQAARNEFEPLAAQGDVKACYLLGMMYRNGEGIPRNNKMAIELFSRAAEQDYSPAQYSLGQMHLAGFGDQQDFKVAHKWLQLAAEQGNEFAQYNLGVMYAKGDGVLQDYAQAYAWYNIAAAKGITEAVGGRDNIALHMTPTQIEEGQRLSKKYASKV